jgi:hypothetical protein
MWPSVVVHEHWPVSQRMIVEMGDYAWSQYIVTIFLIGRKINQRNPKCQNIDELRIAILQEWQQFPQERLMCLVRSMTRRVTELHNKCGGYTRY